MNRFVAGGVVALSLCPAAWAATVSQVSESNFTFTVMAANLTDQPERYEEPGIRILQGLKPDIVALQEFRYGVSQPAELRGFVDLAFGTNFDFYREPGDYAIPNGIVSRWPLVEAGSWDDPELADRGFAWARIALPGTNELFVVSVHWHSSGGASSRAAEAWALRSNIMSQLPAGAWVIVAGDLNTRTREESPFTVLRAFLSDTPIPSDAPSGGNANTNRKRDRPYDYVLTSFSLTNHLVPTRVGGVEYPDGIVFDSARFTPLEGVAPIRESDSTNCQHMAVMKTFRGHCRVTNWIEVPSPRVALDASGSLSWQSATGLAYTVETTTNLAGGEGWRRAGEAASGSGAYRFPITKGGEGAAYYRVRCP
jgi:endonuclease/exonuclease/phosphatase family metal-dependent hydrolase